MEGNYFMWHFEYRTRFYTMLLSALSTNCKTAATAATTVMAENLYVNSSIFIPESAPYALTGTAGTTE